MRAVMLLSESFRWAGSSRWTGLILLLLALAFGPLNAAEPETDPLVLEIQRELKGLGYEVETVDGLMGPNTRAAIEAFEDDRGLPVTGRPSETLRDTLRRIEFQRSREARQTWPLTRLYLQALGYEPGEGGFATGRAITAMAAFIDDHGLDTQARFSKSLHAAVAETAAHDGEAQSTLCRWYVRNSAYADSLPWCERAARNGDVEAQYLVGWMHYYGRGAEQSYTAAFQWYRGAAQGGDSRAQTYLGLMYRQGRGVTRDADAALKWYRRAAESE